MFELEPIDHIVRLAAAGGGFKIDAALLAMDDLVRIAEGAAVGRAQVTLAGLIARPIEELMQVATAGQGHVFFTDD